MYSTGTVAGIGIAFIFPFILALFISDPDMKHWFKNNVSFTVLGVKKKLWYLSEGQELEERTERGAEKYNNMINYRNISKIPEFTMKRIYTTARKSNYFYQYCGSVTFCYGSGSDFSEFRIRIRFCDPDLDPKPRVPDPEKSSGFLRIRTHNTDFYFRFPVRYWI
jgi:hypothetical protein